jgi:hypothetical protein
MTKWSRFFLTALLGFAAVITVQAAVDNIEYLGFNLINPNHLMDVELYGTKAYVSVGFSQGLETYDLSNPFNPIRLSYGGAPNWRSRHYGDTLFVFARENGLRIYRITGATTQVGSCPSGSANIMYEGGARIGNTLYVASHQNGLVSINVANLANPFVTGTFNLAHNACWNVEAAGNHLYIANGRYGLSAVRTIGGLTEVANLDLPGLANDLVIDGETIFVTLGPSGVATVDITDPDYPVLMDIHPSWGSAWGCGLQDHKVAVGSWRYLELFDISNPGNITLAGWENTPTWAMGADMEYFQSGGYNLIAVADWRGMGTYRAGIEPVPDIDVYPLRLDFGLQSGEADCVVVVRNTGGAILNVTNVSHPAGITVQPSSFSVQSGDSLLVTVATTGQSAAGILHYQNNDPNESNFSQYVYVNNTSFPQVGSLAPDFTLQGTNGNWYTLSSYRGQIVFLEFGGGW